MASRYRELADSLRARIQSGEFPVGTRLPRISELQHEYHLPAPNTVRAGLQILVEEGLLTTHPATGAVVTSTEPVTDVTLLDALTHARDNLTTVISTLTHDQPTRPKPHETQIP